MTLSSSAHPHSLFSFFLFNDTATTEIYTLSLHDALPIFRHERVRTVILPLVDRPRSSRVNVPQCLAVAFVRSEEHTSELQSPVHLVCRLLLEKKKTIKDRTRPINAYGSCLRI